MNNLDDINNKKDYSWPVNQTKFQLIGFVKQTMILKPFWIKLISLIPNGLTKANCGDVEATPASFQADVKSTVNTFEPDVKSSPVAVAQSPAKGTLVDSFEGTQPDPPSEEALESERSLTISEDERYSVMQELGRGAIGRVLIASDKRIGREVVIKELLAGKSGSFKSGRMDEATARFLEEAKITGQLDHPGIIPVYDIAKREDGSIYYTMKVVRGETLEDKIIECRTIRDRYKLLIHFLELCQVMSYAHSRNVIHRDIKPANIMIGEFGETMVLDWGMAKFKGKQKSHGDRVEQDPTRLKNQGGRHTVAGNPIGTPCYMSPEQAKGNLKKIDESSDVWSLGAVLYEIFSGMPPYNGDSAWDVVKKVIKEPVVPLRELVPKAAPEICAICDKCLNKNKSERYQDARELAEDIQNFQSGGMVSAYDYSITSIDIKVVLRYLKKRWPVVVTIVTALVILGALVSGLSYGLLTKETKP